MCIYVTREKKYKHSDAAKYCMERDTAGFLAFAETPDESKHISYWVWNDLMQGKDETFFWLGASYHEGAGIWIFKFRGYFAQVPSVLLPSDAVLTDALAKGMKCLAGHTLNHQKLHPMNCDETLPAVCYNWRQTAKAYCDAARGWFLHQDGREWRAKDRNGNDLPPRCYKMFANKKEYERDWYGAQSFCKEEAEMLGVKGKGQYNNQPLNGALATIIDQATNEKIMDLGTGEGAAAYASDSWKLNQRALYIGLYREPKTGMKWGEPGTDFWRYGPSFTGGWDSGDKFEKSWFDETLNTPSYAAPGKFARFATQTPNCCDCVECFPSSVDKEDVLDLKNRGINTRFRTWDDVPCDMVARGFICQMDAIVEDDQYSDEH